MTTPGERPDHSHQGELVNHRVQKPTHLESEQILLTTQTLEVGVDIANLSRHVLVVGRAGRGKQLVGRHLRIGPEATALRPEQVADDLLLIARGALRHTHIDWYGQTVLDTLYEQELEGDPLRAERMLLMATLLDNFLRR